MGTLKTGILRPVQTLTYTVHGLIYILRPFSLTYYTIIEAGIAQWSYGLDDRGFESQQILGVFLITTTSKPALGPNQPPIQCVAGALYLGVKKPGLEADHSPPSSSEVKNAWSCTFSPPIRLHCVVLSESTGTSHLHLPSPLLTYAIVVTQILLG
jgi:hypothetical protein